MIWLVGLDTPLVRMLETGFYEEYHQERQDFGGAVNASRWHYPMSENGPTEILPPLGPMLAAPCASLPTAPHARPRTPAGNAGFSTHEGDSRERPTLCWRKPYSNSRSHRRKPSVLAAAG